MSYSGFKKLLERFVQLLPFKSAIVEKEHHVKNFDGKKFLSAFDAGCTQIHQETDCHRPKDKLYQYTSFEGLKSILTTKKLRFTDYKYFNDPTEIIYGQKLIEKVLVNLQTSPDHRILFSSIMRRIFENFDADYKIYVSCFSLSVDKLALWRYYGCNGTGFAIGFNSAFQQLVTPELSNLGKSIISKVIYGDAAEKELNKFLDQYLKIINAVRDEGGIPDSIAADRFVRDLDSRLASQLISCIPSLKDESFVDENEVRIFYIEGDGMLNPITNKPFYFKEDVREFIPIQRPPIPISFVKNISGNKPVILPEQFQPDHVSDIWIGPCCEFSEARAAIRELLSANGFDVDKVGIQQVKLPYQNF